MKMDFLSLLFYNAACDLDSACSDDRKLGNLYEVIPDVRAALDRFDDKLVNIGVEAGTDAVDDELWNLEECCEKQGFINGFRLGMMLRDELECVQPGHKRGERIQC